MVGYKLSPLAPAQAELTIAPLPGCDLNARACAAELPGGGHLELSITPRPIPVVKPLQVQVRLTAMVADRVEIDFSGVSMDMGRHHQILVADGQGVFSGQAMLPVCVTGRMAWQATLVVNSAGRRIAVPFVFDAPR